MSNKFDKIASAFGTTFQPEDENDPTLLPVKSLEEVNDNLRTKQELLVTGNEVLEDQSYIQSELRMSVELLGDVSETLRSGLNDGSKPSAFDSFANLMREKREYIRELKDTNLRINELKNPQTNTIHGNVTQNNLVMSSGDALDMIRQIIDGPVNNTTFEEM
jgi:hypothetical protein